MWLGRPDPLHHGGQYNSNFITSLLIVIFFSDTLSIHYCNREVNIAAEGMDSEGYIRTPGYPHFYIGDVCGWRLRVHEEQRVRITFLDVSLRSKVLCFVKLLEFFKGTTRVPQNQKKTFSW